METISRTPRRPLHRQLFGEIRQAIVGGILRGGSRLPSTRELAVERGISRKTAEEAYAQLEREGYVERRVGSGTYVCELPLPKKRTARLEGRRALSGRGRAAGASMACVEPVVVKPFSAGVPALEHFPLATWQRLIGSHARRLDHASLVYGDPAGEATLRENVATYLNTSRGVHCDASQVVIVSSSQEALHLLTQLLIDPGEAAWLEEPGYYGARAALTSAGARVVPVPVDREGLDVAQGIALAPNARLAFVTPSNHYPLGAAMSLDRRLALLEWARRNDAWIVEDDYDGEFRYDGRPLTSIQGLDSAGRVIYVGTFTKSLYPSLRLGYVVLPPDLVPSFVTARTQVDGHPPPFMQRVVADFIGYGHFDAHLKRMRALYRERRDAALRLFERHLDVELGPADAGFRVVAFVEKNDRDIAARAAREGLDLPTLSRLYAGRPRNGLVLGYMGLTHSALTQGVKTLARLL
ncbi:MAG TPA: PLP-dependent aminotransferase family protein [Thermoanaerobaculia bacterium]|jgi:GntR family transcriptional regulator/MocR family aminotransferase|nr:PLP-dependent aminotransferase family protein [Thermoanaerobaculia bacterium]